MEITKRRGHAGHGLLLVINGTDHDAVVKLLLDTQPQKRTTRHVYVRAKDQTTLDRIGVGTYLLRFSTGMDWDKEARRFQEAPSYFEFVDPLHFAEEASEDRITYSSFTVTLHPVPEGTAKTTMIDPRLFDEGD